MNAGTAALAYGLTSVSIILFNKAVLSGYHFTFGYTIALGQCLCSVAILSLLRPVLGLQKLTREHARRAWPLAALFLFYVVISISALGSVNLPMFDALRRTNVAVVMALEWAWYRTPPSRGAAAAVAVILVGSVTAAARDFSLDLPSLGLLCAANLSSSLYTLSIRAVKDRLDLSSTNLVYFNSILTLAPLLALTLVSGELPGVLNFPRLGDPGFLLTLLMSLSLACLLNISIFFSMTWNSALTQSIIGMVKNAVVFVLGLLLFSDYTYDFYGFLGLMVSLLGSLLYGYVKIRESRVPKTEHPKFQV